MEREILSLKKNEETLKRNEEKFNLEIVSLRQQLQVFTSVKIEDDFEKIESFHNGNDTTEFDDDDSVKSEDTYSDKDYDDLEADLKPCFKSRKSVSSFFGQMLSNLSGHKKN